VSSVGITQFNIQMGDELTQNVQPLLHEIRHALAALLESGKTSIIDLRSIPLAPGEEEAIIEALGKGEINARLEALGPSDIYETRFAGVWLISHYNEDRMVVSRFIEITELPAILGSQREDMATALETLNEELQKQATS
jgi:hydrogenase-1 operon protein HyaF